MSINVFRTIIFIHLLTTVRLILVGDNKTLTLSQAKVLDFKFVTKPGHLTDNFKWISWLWVFRKTQHFSRTHSGYGGLFKTNYATNSINIFNQWWHGIIKKCWRPKKERLKLSRKQPNPSYHSSFALDWCITQTQNLPLLILQLLRSWRQRYHGEEVCCWPARWRVLGRAFEQLPALDGRSQ